MLALFVSSADAQSTNGMQRTGIVDAIYEGRIVIDDTPYALSDAVVVNTQFSSKGTLARIRAGSVIGFRVGAERVIVEIWLSPKGGRHKR